MKHTIRWANMMYTIFLWPRQWFHVIKLWFMWFILLWFLSLFLYQRYLSEASLTYNRWSWQMTEWAFFLAPTHTNYPGHICYDSGSRGQNVIYFTDNDTPQPIRKVRLTPTRFAVCFIIWFISRCLGKVQIQMSCKIVPRLPDWIQRWLELFSLT